MISKHRERHIFAVADLLKKYGEERGYSESSCAELYTLGLLHDIGYAFVREQDYRRHNQVGGELLKEQGYRFWREVFYHGVVNSPYTSEYLDLLNLADMHIDSEGKYVSFNERLNELSKRYKTEVEKLDSFAMVQELRKKGFD